MSFAKFFNTEYAQARFSILFSSVVQISSFISFASPILPSAHFTAFHIFAQTVSRAFTTDSADVDKSVKSHSNFQVLTRS